MHRTSGTLGIAALSVVAAAVLFLWEDPTHETIHPAASEAVAIPDRPARRVAVPRETAAPAPLARVGDSAPITVAVSLSAVGFPTPIPERKGPGQLTSADAPPGWPQPGAMPGRKLPIAARRALAASAQPAEILGEERTSEGSAPVGSLAGKTAEANANSPLPNGSSELLPSESETLLAQFQRATTDLERLQILESTVDLPGGPDVVAMLKLALSPIYSADVRVQAVQLAADAAPDLLRSLAADPVEVVRFEAEFYRQKLPPVTTVLKPLPGGLSSRLQGAGVPKVRSN